MTNISVPEEVVENYLRDITKKRVDKAARAHLIKEYLHVTGMNEYELTKKLGISRPLLTMWLRQGTLTTEIVKELKAKGMTTTQIYWQANRDTRPETMTEKNIQNCINTIKPLLNHHLTPTTLTLLHQLKDLINRIEMRHEKRNKGT